VVRNNEQDPHQSSTDQCCRPKEEGKPGTSNLHVMLRYRVLHFQPYGGGRWAPSLEYFIQPRFQTKRGSTTWNKVGTSWRVPVRELIPIQLNLLEEVSSELLWWSLFSAQVGASFFRNQVVRLHKVGLRQIVDSWVENRFFTMAEDQVWHPSYGGRYLGGHDSTSFGVLGQSSHSRPPGCYR
jgi:hypothetical protein